ncbi:uncharacterized protein [Parasteatoda tepidariorum]|uniref:uncharacterized protein n=1 Tax=Parasteatoda tepidariorum TaxID=114398 RepID=UPI0039BCFE4A
MDLKEGKTAINSSLDDLFTLEPLPLDSKFDVDDEPTYKEQFENMISKKSGRDSKKDARKSWFGFFKKEKKEKSGVKRKENAYTNLGVSDYEKLLMEFDKRLAEYFAEKRDHIDSFEQKNAKGEKVIYF